MKERTFICWALRDGDQMFYQGFGYPTLYATEEEAERDIRNPHLNSVQVEVTVQEVADADYKAADYDRLAAENERLKAECLRKEIEIVEFREEGDSEVELLKARLKKVSDVAWNGVSPSRQIRELFVRWAAEDAGR